MTDRARQDNDFYEQAKKRFIAWAAASPAERLMLGLPSSRKAWATQNGVSQRDASEWAEKFADEAEHLRVQKVVQSGGSSRRFNCDAGRLVGAWICCLVGGTR